MFEDLTKSIKVKLCEFQYSSFMSSFMIAYLLLNHKYILIYFSSIDVHRKILMMEYQGLCFSIPLLIALAYIYIYPYFGKLFYKAALNNSNKLKDIKLDKDNERAIGQEEKNALFNEIVRMKKELFDRDQMIMEMEKVNDESQKRIIKMYEEEKKNWNNNNQTATEQLMKEAREIKREDELFMERNEVMQQQKELENQKENEELLAKDIIEEAHKEHKKINASNLDQVKLAQDSYNNTKVNDSNLSDSDINNISNSITIDEKILLYINRIGEANIEQIHNNFSYLSMNGIEIKIKKLKAQDLIKSIDEKNEIYYYLTNSGKSLVNQIEVKLKFSMPPINTTN